MIKVALYARYSSGSQSVASIEDQLRICREHAARERWKVIGNYRGDGRGRTRGHSLCVAGWRIGA